MKSQVLRIIVIAFCYYPMLYLIMVKRKSLKLVSFLLLFSMFFLFTGFLTPVYVTDVKEVEKSCCDGCNKTEGQKAEHCSTQDCPAFLCLSINTISPFTLINFWTSISNTHYVEEFYLTSFIKSVFHPPAIC